MKLQFLIENYNFLYIQQIQSVFLLLYLEINLQNFCVKIEKITHVSIFFDFLKIFCIYSCEYHSMSNRFILLFSFHLWFFEVFLIFFFFPSSFYVSTFFPFYFYYFFSFSFPSIKEIKLLDSNFSLLLHVITSGCWCKVYYMIYSIKKRYWYFPAGSFPLNNTVIKMLNWHLQKVKTKSNTECHSVTANNWIWNLS